LWKSTVPQRKQTNKHELTTHFVDVGPSRLTVLAAVVRADDPVSAKADVREVLPGDEYELVGRFFEGLCSSGFLHRAA
jgi:hypothetical protein